MRALIVIVVLAACSTRVVDLGREPDAAIDASPTPTNCQCRVPCANSTAVCVTQTACGTDGYCVGSVGTCTATTPSPCNVDYPTSVCVANSTAACTF